MQNSLGVDERPSSPGKWRSRLPVVLLAGLFVAFVWPTPWHYYECTDRVNWNSGERPARSRRNRFTNQVEWWILGSDEWHKYADQ